MTGYSSSSQFYSPDPRLRLGPMGSEELQEIKERVAIARERTYERLSRAAVLHDRAAEVQDRFARRDLSQRARERAARCRSAAESALGASEKGVLEHAERQLSRHQEPRKGRQTRMHDEQLNQPAVLRRQIWLTYKAIGGSADFPAVEAHYDGKPTLNAHERAVLEHAKWEQNLEP